MFGRPPLRRAALLEETTRATRAGSKTHRVHYDSFGQSACL